MIRSACKAERYDQCPYVLYCGAKSLIKRKQVKN